MNYIYTISTNKGLEDYIIINAENIEEAFVKLYKNDDTEIKSIIKKYYGEDYGEDAEKDIKIYGIYQKSDKYVMSTNLGYILSYQELSLDKIIDIINQTEIEESEITLYDNSITLSNSESKQYRLQKIDKILE